jgi:hypothetical protein
MNLSGGNLVSKCAFKCNNILLAPLRRGRGGAHGVAGLRRRGLHPRPAGGPHQHVRQQLPGASRADVDTDASELDIQ